MNLKKILIGSLFLGTLSFGGSTKASEICEIKISDNFNSPEKIYPCDQSKIKVSKKKVIIPLEDGLTLKLSVDGTTISGGKISERLENSQSGCQETSSGFSCSFGGGFTTTTTSLTPTRELSTFKKDPLEIQVSFYWYSVDFFNRKFIEINIK